MAEMKHSLNSLVIFERMIKSRGTYCIKTITLDKILSASFSVKLILVLLCLQISLITKAQVNSILSAEIKSYLFHVVRKSPILERNFGYAFEYFGPNIPMKGGQTNYDSLESIIINEPELLVIRSAEIAKAPKGLILELSNKTAVWMLNKTLNSIQTGKNEINKEIFDCYLLIFSENLPKQIERSKNYEAIFDPKRSPIFNSNLSLYDRCVLLGQLGFVLAEEQVQILEAQHKAINETIEKYTLQIFRNLGGKSNEFENYLLAAGDGSYTAGILAERERDDEGNWNKGLPKAIGLFPYDVKVESKEVVPYRMISRTMETCGNEKQTNLHFDVWGYNTTKQTTIVIEKNGYSYHLFGSENTRFLSPDSTFSKGATFQNVINDLHNNTFKELENSLKGKNGYNEQVTTLQKSLEEVYVLIQQKEAEYGEHTKQNYHTPKHLTRKDQKFKKENSFGGPINQTPNTKSKRKARNRRQTELVDLYLEYEAIESELNSLVEERAPVLKEYQDKKGILDNYKRQMGLKWVNFTEVDGLYIFDDSTTFDIKTQEFIFPASDKQETFEIRLIAIPEDLVGENADEVMMHVSKVDIEPFYDADIKIEFKDLFESDAYTLSKTIFQGKDSTLLKKFFQQIDNTQLTFIFEINGNGVGKWENGSLIKDFEAIELPNYPGKTTEEMKIARADSLFASLRKTNLFMKVDRLIYFRIDSYTDPVISNLVVKNHNKIQELITSGKITKNDALSAFRSVAVMNQLKLELNINASKYLSQEKAKKLIDQLNSSIEKSRVKVGNEVLRYKDFRI
jgi:hypothetical protein